MSPLKSDTRLDLLNAIKSVATHKAFFTAKVAEALLASFLVRSRGEATTLSDRERSVVQLIAEGHTKQGDGNDPQHKFEGGRDAASIFDEKGDLSSSADCPLRNSESARGALNPLTA